MSALEISAREQAQKQWNAIACGELEGDKNQVEYFDRVAEDRYRQQPWQHRYFRFADFAGKRVLEIGVGQGTDLMQFANAGAICHGVDITDNHLVLTQRNFDLHGKSVDLKKGDATNIPWPDGYFDCVYSFGVMHHIPEIDLVLQDVRRVLKPQGTLMIALYYKWSAFHLCWKLLCQGLYQGWLFSKGYAGLLATIEGGADGVTTKPYVRLYTKAEVRRLLEGFVVEDISVHQLTADSFWPSALGRMLRNHVASLEKRLGWYVACKARKR